MVDLETNWASSSVTFHDAIEFRSLVPGLFIWQVYLEGTRNHNAKVEVSAAFTLGTKVSTETNDRGPGVAIAGILPYDGLFQLNRIVIDVSLEGETYSLGGFPGQYRAMNSAHVSLYFAEDVEILGTLSGQLPIIRAGSGAIETPPSLDAPSGPSTPVPEPASLALFMIGALVVSIARCGQRAAHQRSGLVTTTAENSTRTTTQGHHRPSAST